MKKMVLATVSTLAISGFAADLIGDDQKMSYVFGAQFGETLKVNVSDLVAVDKEILFEGISDALAGKALKLDSEEMDIVIKNFSDKALAKLQEQMIEANRAEADKLLAENAQKEGVKTTKSGLQYRVIQAGEGKKPTASDTVKVHYKGTLADGTLFDSSYDRGEPAEFPLQGVIPGWTEGLQLMSVGSKYELVIPADLAYGQFGPGEIGPDRALIFEVELLDIK